MGIMYVSFTSIYVWSVDVLCKDAISTCVDVEDKGAEFAVFLAVKYITEMSVPVYLWLLAVIHCSKCHGYSLCTQID